MAYIRHKLSKSDEAALLEHASKRSGISLNRIRHGWSKLSPLKRALIVSQLGIGSITLPILGSVILAEAGVPVVPAFLAGGIGVALGSSYFAEEASKQLSKRNVKKVV